MTICSILGDRGGQVDLRIQLVISSATWGSVGRALEQAVLALGEFATEIFVGSRGGDTSAGRAVEHADLHEIGLVHFLYGVFFFAESGSESADTYRTAGIFIEEGEEEVAVDFIEAVLIDAEHFESFLCDF